MGRASVALGVPDSSTGIMDGFVIRIPFFANGIRPKFTLWR